MNHSMKITIFFLFILVAFNLSLSAQDGEEIQNYSIWIGSNYIDHIDYYKKVGEYNRGREELSPEFKGNYLFNDGKTLIRAEGHYFDEDDFRAGYKQTFRDYFNAEFYYNSFTHQEQQDLLKNLSAREWFGEPLNKWGGKILTHELTDVGADYDVQRKEFGAKIEALLYRKHNIKMTAAHRAIFKTGEKQKLSNNHCFSCHVTSKSSEVDQVARQFEIGIQGDIDDFTLAYELGFRNFRSEAPDDYFYFDNALHPGFGRTDGVSDYEGEFGSRLIYDGVYMPVGTYPETDKISHKFKFKGDIGKSRFIASAGYSRAENKRVELQSTAWTGAFNYSVLLSRKMRLILKAAGIKIEADDPEIDLPEFRAGRPGPHHDFDFTRYSSLDRTDWKGSAEIITRLNRATTVSALLGYQSIDRVDYPEKDAHWKTKKLIGQLKMNYRKGLKYSNNIKYRFEKISDPFTSGRGLFELSGRETLTPLPQPFRFVFYFQREDLRYQNITTLPTEIHEFDFDMNYRPVEKTNIRAGLKVKLDKNGDLDSLDVKHSSFQPNIALTVSPGSRWNMTTGYTYNFYKSRGPVTVALFDG